MELKQHNTGISSSSYSVGYRLVILFVPFSEPLVKLKSAWYDISTTECIRNFSRSESDELVVFAERYQPNNILNTYPSLPSLVGTKLQNLLDTDLTIAADNNIDLSASPIVYFMGHGDIRGAALHNGGEGEEDYEEDYQLSYVRTDLIALGLDRYFNKQLTVVIWGCKTGIEKLGVEGLPNNMIPNNEALNGQVRIVLKDWPNTSSARLVWKEFNTYHPNNNITVLGYLVSISLPMQGRKPYALPYTYKVKNKRDDDWQTQKLRKKWARGRQCEINDFAVKFQNKSTPHDTNIAIQHSFYAALNNVMRLVQKDITRIVQAGYKFDLNLTPQGISDEQMAEYSNWRRERMLANDVTMRNVSKSSPPGRR